MTSNIVKNAAEQKQYSLTEILKDIIPSLLNLVTFVTASGFVVINSYLSSITHLFTYNINVSQYIAAGINFLFITILIISLSTFAASFTTAIFIEPFIRIRIQNRIKQSPSYEILKDLSNYSESDLRARWNLLAEKDPSFNDPILQSEFIEKVYPLLKLIQKYQNTKISFNREFLNNFVRQNLIIYALLIVLIGPIYGKAFYAITPRWLGGGENAEVILIFKDDISTTGLPISISSANPKRSQKVKLLVELTDGILVFDENQQVAIAIKNDVLAGIADDSVSKSATVMPTTTATPTPSFTPTP